MSSSSVALLDKASVSKPFEYFRAIPCQLEHQKQGLKKSRYIAIREGPRYKELAKGGFS